MVSGESSYGDSQLNIHLIVSVLLTDTPLHRTNIYGPIVSLTKSKVDQFLGALHSMHKLPLKSQDFYLSFDGNYKVFQNLVCARILELYPNARISNQRLYKFEDWKSSSLTIPNQTDLVLLQSNHDHVFTHESVADFYSFCEDLIEFGPLVLGEISSWPEYISNSRKGDWRISRKNQNHLQVGKCVYSDGTCLVSPDLYKSWWSVDFTDGKKIVRPDNPFGPSVQFRAVNRVVPATEFFRHLDGYGHIDLNNEIANAIPSCCTVKNNTIEHLEWVRGSFLLAKNNFIDLPTLPNSSRQHSFQEIIDLILLGCSYRVNFRNIYHLVAQNESRHVHKRIVYFFDIFTNALFWKELNDAFRRKLKFKSILIRITYKIYRGYLAQQSRFKKIANIKWIKKIFPK